MKKVNAFIVATMREMKGMGSKCVQMLVEHFGTAEAVWQAEKDTLAATGVMTEEQADQFIAERSKLQDRPQRMEEECEKLGIKLVSLWDEGYPLLLREISAPPTVLFYKGELLGDRPRIAMVGARKLSPYGRNVAEQLGSSLAGAGFSVVSGAAYGIDAASHEGALKRGVTEAVLACGLDIAYPPRHKGLLEKIAEAGAVISEYAPGTMPLREFFPARNRIISGMSLGTVVVEAAERSGSLITAEQALSEGRDVFAVPGSVFSPVSRGCHKLIQQGAKLILDSCDIMEEYTEVVKIISNTKNNSEKNATHAIITEAEGQILRILSPDEPLSLDEVIYRLHGRKVVNAAFILLQLEFKGLVRSDDLHRYVRTVKEGVL